MHISLQHCLIIVLLRAQLVSIAQMLQTIQFPVQMEHSVIPQELAIYPSVIYAPLGAFVQSPTVVFMDTNVRMAHIALLEGLHLLFALLVTFANKPNRKYHALKGITVPRDLLRLYLVLRDITVIRPIDVIMIHTIKMQGPVIQIFVH